MEATSEITRRIGMLKVSRAAGFEQRREGELGKHDAERRVCGERRERPRSRQMSGCIKWWPTVPRYYLGSVYYRESPVVASLERGSKVLRWKS